MWIQYSNINSNSETIGEKYLTHNEILMMRSLFMVNAFIAMAQKRKRG